MRGARFLAVRLRRLEKRARRKLAHAWFERRLSVETSDVVSLEDLGVAGRDRVGYEPAEWSLLRRVLRKREMSSSDVFVDFGSGMGRVVLRAAEYGPGRVVGVELSDELNRIARRNVERNRGRLKCDDIELITADVLDYDIPDDLTIAFFNNPFTGEVFAEVVRRLVASHDRNPRRMRVIYRNPREEGTLLASGRFRLVREGTPGFRWGPRRGVTVRMYEAQARREGG